MGLSWGHALSGDRMVRGRENTLWASKLCLCVLLGEGPGRSWEPTLCQALPWGQGAHCLKDPAQQPELASAQSSALVAGPLPSLPTHLVGWLDGGRLRPH